MEKKLKKLDEICEKQKSFQMERDKSVGFEKVLKKENGEMKMEVKNGQNKSTGEVCFFVFVGVAFSLRKTTTCVFC